MLLPQVLQLEYQTELASIEGARDVEIHLLKENDDLQKIALELEQWVKKRLKNRPADNVSRLFMDITYATPVRSAAALFCSLDQDIELIKVLRTANYLRTIWSARSRNNASQLTM